MIVKEFFFFDMDELSRPFDHVKQAKERPPKTQRRKTGSSVFARRPPAPTEQKDLIRFEPSLRSERKALGPSIRQARKPASQMIDGDGDGKCQEEGGRWVPCPPGVARGSILRRSVGGASVFDLPEGGGIDEELKLPDEFKAAMAERMKTLGITRKQIAQEARKALAAATPEMVEKAKQWYTTVHTKTRGLVSDLNKKYGTKYGFEQAAAVIAALSPAREFQKNMRDARKMFVVMAEDLEFSPPEELIASFKGDRKVLAEVLKRAKNGKLRPSDFTDSELSILAVIHPEIKAIAGMVGFDSVFKAMHILRGGEIDKILSGPKVRSFYSNIVNPDGNRATIDTWMYRIMTPPGKKFKIGPDNLTLADHEAGKKTTPGKDGKPKKRRTQDIFQGSPSGYGVGDNVGLYPIFAEVIRELAAQEGIPPAALQAILWEVARIQAGYKPTQWEKIFKELELS